MKIKLFCVIILSLIQINTAFSQSTFEFLRIDKSARAAALAGSFVANNDDPNVIFYNPAGLKFLQNSPASFSFVKYLKDINLASVTYSTKFEKIGRFGFGAEYINYGSFTEADEFGNKLGEFNVNELAFVAGYANELDNNFYYGANVKFIYSGIADRSATAIGFDLGLHYVIPESQWNFGFSMTNIGTQISSYYETKESIPFEIKAGIAKKLEHLPLRIFLTFNRLNEKQDDFIKRFKAFSIGTEFTLSSVLRLRLGFDNQKRDELKVGTSAGLAGFNIGLGAVISDYTFDYAFSSWGLIGGLHRISVATTF